MFYESASSLVDETNPLQQPGHVYAAQIKRGFPVDWTTPGLTITRLRLVSDPGFPVWDVSYCHGLLNGDLVEVQLPFSQLPKKGMRKALYSHAKASGKFIQGLFNSLSTLQ